MALKLPRGRLKPQKTIPVTLDLPDGKSLTLHVRYAGRANAGYFNAQVSTPEPKPSGDAATTSTASDLRLAKIYADHVIVGWDNVFSEDGSPATYTPELGLELLTWLIAEEQRPDKFRAVAFEAVNPANFERTDADQVATGEA